MHKLRELVHIKGNIGSCHPEMLEATNHLTDMLAFIGAGPSAIIREVPIASRIETILESSMLCLLRRSITYFCCNNRRPVEVAKTSTP